MAGTANAVNGPEAAPYLAKAGGTMTGNLILNGAPSTSLQAATKAYVDNATMNSLTACLCASTAALTVTYDNGSSGVGATLTNAGAMAAFSVDGASPAVNDRVLIKNQASALQNGIYTVTTVGSGAANWVLTRATDYDEASEMQAGDKVAVVSGTTQAVTEWMMTQTAAITVGVTSITWAEMGQVTAAVTSVVMQVFTANGTYTPTTGMIFCIVEMVGGGGGSGGTSGAAGQVGVGGGGGGGQYSRSIKTAAQIGASQAVTIGAGGTAGASGTNNGGNGGTTSLGVLVTAVGGDGGQGGVSGAGATFGGPGGAGGAGGTADLTIQGGRGFQGNSINGAVGVGTAAPGGASFFGLGQSARGAGVGQNFGSGASGAFSDAANAAGAAGASGIVVITEFVSTSA